MRKDTVIMVVLVAGVAAGVYKGLQIVAPNQKKEDASQGVIETETAVTSESADAGMDTVEAVAPSAEATTTETTGADEAPAQESLEVISEDSTIEAPADTTTTEAAPTVESTEAATAEAPAAEPSVSETSPATEPAADAGSATPEASAADSSGGQPDEMEEAAVRAAVAEAQRTAAEAAEKAAREAYRARKASQ